MALCLIGLGWRGKTVEWETFFFQDNFKRKTLSTAQGDRRCDLACFTLSSTGCCCVRERRMRCSHAPWPLPSDVHQPGGQICPPKCRSKASWELGEDYQHPKVNNFSMHLTQKKQTENYEKERTVPLWNRASGMYQIFWAKGMCVGRSIGGPETSQ